MNPVKTKFMTYNHSKSTTIQTSKGFQLELTDFGYLGALMESSEKDVMAREAAAWQACNKLGKIRKPSLPRLFRSAYLLLIMWS